MMDAQQRIRRWLDDRYLPVSYSALKRYEECPRQSFWLRDHEDEGGAAGRLGTAAHQYVYQRVSGRERQPLDIPLDMAQDFAAMLPRLDEIVAQLLADPDLVGVEENLLIERELPNGVIAQGRAILDALSITPDGRATIIDYKSGWVIPTEEDLRTGASQGLWYAWAAREQYGHIWEVEFRLATLRPERRPVTVTYTPWDIDAFEVALLDKLSIMAEDREFLPHPGEKRCRLCPLLLQCDAGTALVGPLAPTGGDHLGALDSPERIGAFALALVQREAQVEAARGMLKSLTEWYGPVSAGGDLYYGHHVERWKSLPVTDFIRLMEAAGVPEEEIHACLRVDRQKADKYVWGSKRPPRKPIPGLREIEQVELHTKFDRRKLK